MQDLSYFIKEPLFRLGGFEFGFRIYTFENVYVLNPKDCSIMSSSDCMDVKCSRFDYAGNRLHAEGTFEAHITLTDDGIRISSSCTMSKTIRNIKLSVYNLPKCSIINLREGITDILADGCVYTYPSGWRGLYTPLAILKPVSGDGRFYYARSTDDIVREKRFAFLPSENSMTLELIHEETGSHMSRSVRVPAWEIGICDNPETVYEKQAAHIRDCYKIAPWDTRSDVPGWMRDISLIASIHMEHWTGYTFHTYKSVIETARWIGERIEPEHVLLYLPGWDGRYYWKYGQYGPSESMGGEDGFKEMMKTLKDMGFYVMLMVGMNMAARVCENFEQWGASSLSVNVSGIPQYTLVDWDGSRHCRHGFNAMLNIGAPRWQTHLTEEITRLYYDYGFDAMFLDISAAWTNEQLFDDYTGIQSFIQALHKVLPADVLIAGEGWYDALGAVTPLVQSGHTDGVLHWHDEPYSAMFEPFCRSFGHLCLGDPGRGSTGVHELGMNPIRNVPYRKGIIPTVTIVEDTLETAAHKVEEIIGDAKRYAKEFL